MVRDDSLEQRSNTRDQWDNVTHKCVLSGGHSCSKNFFSQYLRSSRFHVFKNPHFLSLKKPGHRTISRHSLLLIICRNCPLRGRVLLSLSQAPHPLEFLQRGVQVSVALYHYSCIVVFIQQWEWACFYGKVSPPPVPGPFHFCSFPARLW